MAGSECEGIESSSQVALGLVVQRVGVEAQGIQAAHLALKVVVSDVVHQNGLRHHGVQRVGGAGYGEPGRKPAALYEVVHEPAGHVVAGGRHIVVAAAEPRVDLEEHVAAIARIHLDVEVREAGVAHGLQKPRRLGHDGFVYSAHNGQRVAHPHGPHVFQKRLAEGGEAHFSRLIGIGGQDAHMGVVTGNGLLNEKRSVVAAFLHGAEHAGELGAVAGEEHLLLAGKVGIVVGRRGGGLGHDGEGEGELQRGGVELRVGQIHHNGARGGHADFGAQGVETLLVGEAVQEILTDVGDDEGVFELGAHLHDGAHVPVTAAEQQQGAVVEALGHIGQGGQQHLAALQMRYHPVHEDGGVAAHVAVGLGQHEGDDAVGLVEGSGQAVGADVAPQYHRQHVGGVRFLHGAQLLNSHCSVQGPW
nr:hypothetical protein [Adlercreutzia caecimuris]